MIHSSLEYLGKKKTGIIKWMIVITNFVHSNLSTCYSLPVYHCFFTMSRFEFSIKFTLDSPGDCNPFPSCLAN
jgi:hypothetical protein